MSEYQYYEFQAVDRPLDRAAMEALRLISSRARITSTSFTNHYEWGDLKGDPREFMERWFDLHLYLANWGTRRLMMRLPRRFLAPEAIAPFVAELDWVAVWTTDDSVIVDLCQDHEGGDWGDAWDPEDDEDGAGRLAALAPLRADVKSGDLRVFYLVWLAAVEAGLVTDDTVEPLPGIAPLSGALEAFAAFFRIDPDLVEAAAESGAAETASRDDMRKMLAAIAEDDKTELLLRLVEGDASVGAELKRRVRATCPNSPVPHRTAGALRARAQEFAAARERAAAARRETEQRQRAEQAEKERRARLESLKQRGEAVWRELETEIERRNPTGYDRAMKLLSDLGALAVEDGTEGDFAGRLVAIRTRHEKKGRFIERLATLEYVTDESPSLLQGR